MQLQVRKTHFSQEKPTETVAFLVAFHRLNAQLGFLFPRFCWDNWGLLSFYWIATSKTSSLAIDLGSYICSLLQLLLHQASALIGNFFLHVSLCTSVNINTLNQALGLSLMHVSFESAFCQKAPAYPVEMDLFTCNGTAFILSLIVFGFPGCHLFIC